MLSTPSSPALENAAQPRGSSGRVRHLEAYDTTASSQPMLLLCSEADTHVDCSYLPIHELILRRRTLQPFARQLHRIPGIVDIGQHLHWYHGSQGLHHIVNRGEVLDDIIPEKPSGFSLRRCTRGKLTLGGQLACLRRACRVLWSSH